MENPMKMDDDWGVSQFMETSIYVRESMYFLWSHFAIVALDAATACSFSNSSPQHTKFHESKLEKYGSCNFEQHHVWKKNIYP